MNIRDYFEVTSLEDKVFRFRFSGFFSEEVIAGLKDDIVSEYRKAIDSFSGRPFINLVDLRGLKAMSDDGKAMVAELMTYGMERGLYYSININPSALSKLSISTAGKQSHTEDKRTIVATSEEAEALLAEKLKEI